MKKQKLIIGLAAGAGAIAAASYLLFSKDIPEGARAIEPFDKNRYMGVWNEIARMPSRIEKNLNQLTEDYLLNADGSIKVITKAYNIKKDKWVQAAGRIKFAGDENTGMLKVSYFGPFYLAYNVLAVDDDYQHALVSGSGLGYLWLLSKQSAIPDDIKNSFLQTATDIGFDTTKLEWM